MRKRCQLINVDVDVAMFRYFLFSSRFSAVWSLATFSAYFIFVSQSPFPFLMGVNRGGKYADSYLFFAKSVDPTKILFKSEATATSENKVLRFKGKLVTAAWLAQLVERRTAVREVEGSITEGNVLRL